MSALVVESDTMLKNESSFAMDDAPNGDYDCYDISTAQGINKDMEESEGRDKYMHVYNIALLSDIQHR